MGDDDIEIPDMHGVAILIQLRDASHYDADGVRHFTRAEPVRMVLHDPQRCWPNAEDGDDPDDVAWSGPDQAHQQTVCAECLRSWSEDYLVTLAETPGDLGLA